MSATQTSVCVIDQPAYILSDTPPLTPSRSDFGSEYSREEPRTTHLVLPVRRGPPPPRPTVEDEEVSLAREHGSPTVDLEDEPPSRGDVEQNPVIMEVHEHNPERRFVIIPNAEPSDGKTTDDESPTKKVRADRPIIDEPEEAKENRRYEPVFDERLSAGEEERRRTRRRSRNDLPPIDTDMRPERKSEHHRTRSAVGGSRPEAFTPGPKPPPHEDLLSPDVIKHGSGRRDKEKPYREYGGSGQGQAPVFLHRRSYSNIGDERRGDKYGRRGSISPNSAGRSSSNVEARPSRRRMSNERRPESRYREEYVPTRSNTKDSKTRDAPRRPDGDRPIPPPHKQPTSSVRREDARSSDDSLNNGRDGRHRQDSITMPQEPDRAPSPGKDRQAPLGPRTRGPTLPSIPGGLPPIRSLNPRSSATFPIISSEARDSRLPYPDEDPAPRMAALQGKRENTWSNTDYPSPAVSMPEFPPIDPFGAGVIGTPVSTTSTQKPWQPPAFDPERDGVPLDEGMGYYRRYSEGKGRDGATDFPECQRKEPIAGKMDWLTLVRTDFNICPGCYEGVFSRTPYRNEFQPILRPTDKPIACDFGTSPWYRIAWLLTALGEKSDLRLLKRVANEASACRTQPCPGSRRETLPWLTIRDPSRRRPVPNFTVCLQCAKIVETLLPNMEGVFVPLDLGSDISKSVCSLHFTPKRKRFALYFDALETTSHKAISSKRPPNIASLASKLERLGAVEECREDSPVPYGYWHVMQFLPEFTVCGECFDEAVRPKLLDDNLIAKNFYMEKQRLREATCQLYSARMREIFSKACRRNDPKLLEARVRERLEVEADIHGKLVKLDRAGHDKIWTDQQVSKLVEEWKRWE